MRPVSIPNVTQQEYDEAGELGRTKHIKNPAAKPAKGKNVKPAATSTMTVRQLVNELQGLVNKWVDAGSQTQKKGHATVKKWGSVADEARYNLLHSVKVDGYGNSRGALIARIGQVCSYCEAPVYSHMHVEHRLAKDSFPAHALSWPNFLISCPTCNSIKGDTPDQSTPNRKSESDSVTYNTNNYFWPNAYWSAFQNGSPLPFRYELKTLAHVRSKWVFKNALTSKELASWLGDYRSGKAAVRDGKMSRPTQTRGYDYIGLEISWGTTLNNTNQGIVRATLGLTDVNKLLNAVKAQKSIDRRIEMRTATYFKALVLAERLKDVESVGNQTLTDAVSRQAAKTIAATGFWGVWFHVFRSAGLDSRRTQDILRNLFPGTAATVWA